MRKQRKRIYAALLCSSMVLSLVSTPVSAAETGQLTNPPTSTEGPGSPESASGNEAAAMLNGLSVLAANGEAEVTTASELTGALADSSISRITLKGDIDIGSTLTVNRTVTLDLNGCVLKMTGSDSVIKVAAAVCLLPAVHWSWPVATSSDVRQGVKAAVYTWAKTLTPERAAHSS